ncbi:DUF5984 family protein [Nocardia sp. SYP-A9097]|uniref:DUF5984 family protein n=1 Tax=Nocardia sp. SYP-A9097 TaxID=2663237 RepID=UPI0035C92CB8
MTRFRFEPVPVDAVTPCGSAGNRRLFWFALTEGWFCLEIGGVELSRLTAAQRNSCRAFILDDRTQRVCAAGYGLGETGVRGGDGRRVLGRATAGGAGDLVC